MVTTHLTSNPGGGPPSSIAQSPGPGGPGSVGGPSASLNGGIGMQKSLVAQGPPSSQQSGMYNFVYNKINIKQLKVYG